MGLKNRKFLISKVKIRIVFFDKIKDRFTFYRPLSRTQVN